MTDIDQQISMLQKMTTPAELHPDLQICLFESPGLGTTLKHPLVFGVPYHPQFHSMYNQQYELKKEYIQKACEQKDWSQYIFLYERPYRLVAFQNIKSRLSDSLYWEVLGSILTDSENLYQYKQELKSFINCRRSGKEQLMIEDDRATLAQFPDEITVYRGCNNKNRSGFSWTLSSGIARWFANRYQIGTPLVLQGRVAREHIHAYFSTRQESEVLINPQHVFDVRPLLSLTRPAWLEKIWSLNRTGFSLHSSRTAHGPHHWEQVERYGLKLAQDTPGCDSLVVRLFAVFHDACRVNEHDDPEHGLRAAALVSAHYEYTENEGLPITDYQFNQLRDACACHADGQISGDPTIGVCWDADRLDLPRVGIIPDPEYLSTEFAKSHILNL